MLCFTVDCELHTVHLIESLARKPNAFHHRSLRQIQNLRSTCISRANTNAKLSNLQHQQLEDKSHLSTECLMLEGLGWPVILADPLIQIRLYRLATNRVELSRWTSVAEE